MAHSCHHPHCTKTIPPRLLACGGHWAALPVDLREAIYKNYRAGQEVDKKISKEYKAAFNAAIEWWKEYPKARFEFPNKLNSIQWREKQSQLKLIRIVKCSVPWCGNIVASSYAGSIGGKCESCTDAWMSEVYPDPRDD